MNSYDDLINDEMRKYRKEKEAAEKAPQDDTRQKELLELAKKWISSYKADADRMAAMFWDAHNAKPASQRRSATVDWASGTGGNQTKLLEKMRTRLSAKVDWGSSKEASDRHQAMLAKMEEDVDWSLAPESESDPSPEGHAPGATAGPEQPTPARASKVDDDDDPSASLTAAIPQDKTTASLTKETKKWRQGRLAKAAAQMRGEDKDIGGERQRGKFQASARADFFDEIGFPQLKNWEKVSQKYDAWQNEGDEESGARPHKGEGQGNQSGQHDLTAAIKELTKVVKELKDAMKNPADKPGPTPSGGFNPSLPKQGQTEPQSGGRQSVVAGQIPTVTVLRQIMRS